MNNRGNWKADRFRRVRKWKLAKSGSKQTRFESQKEVSMVSGGATSLRSLGYEDLFVTSTFSGRTVLSEGRDGDSSGPQAIKLAPCSSLIIQVGFLHTTDVQIMYSGVYVPCIYWHAR